MIKLNLGCWKRNFGPEWLHIDKCNLPHIYSHDIANLPFNDNSVDLIYCSHALEYFDRSEAEEVLESWYSKLKEGGTLRLAVPDFDALWELYKIEGNLDLLLGPLYGKMDIDGNKIYHKTVYDYHSLVMLLRKVGFRDAERYDWREIEPHNIHDDHSQCYYPHMDKENGLLLSLNVQCVK